MTAEAETAAEVVRDRADVLIDLLGEPASGLETATKKLSVRVRRLANHVERELRRELAAEGIEVWEFEVLLALSRAPGQQLTAGALLRGSQVTAGAITYQLQVSRALNPYSAEDSQYVKGLTRLDQLLRPNQLWYGVFLWAKNQTKVTASTDNTFDIVDTEGNHYYPLPISPALNGYAWTKQTLAPGEIRKMPPLVSARFLWVTSCFRKVPSTGSLQTKKADGSFGQ